MFHQGLILELSCAIKKYADLILLTLITLQNTIMQNSSFVLTWYDNRGLLEAKIFPNITVGEEDLNTFSGARVFQKNFFKWSFTLPRVNCLIGDLKFAATRDPVFIIDNVCCSHLPNMLTFLILIRLGYGGIVPNDIKNLFKNQEIEQKPFTDRKFKLTLHVIYIPPNALSTNKFHQHWKMAVTDLSILVWIVAVHQWGLCFLNV